MGLSPAIHVLGRPMAVPGPFFFLNRRRRPSADALVRMAGDRSGSLTGSARQAPSLGPLFRARPHPGRCAGTPKVCGHPSAPCAAASALRHWPPRRGAAGYGPPLLRGFACRLRRHQRTAPVPVSARLARANAACARPSLRRRPGPPPPAHGAAPRLRFLRVTWSYGSPLGCSVWACGPPSAPLRVRLRPFCAPSQWVPPGRPRPRPALPRPSVGWSPGWAAGSAPPAWGLERPCGPLLYGPGPRRREQMQSGACLWILAGADRGASSGFVSAVSADSISIYRKSFCKL